MLPRGGMGALADALTASARAMGAELRLDSDVVSIDSEGGAARGVTLASGEHLEAEIVLSDVDPRTTLLELVDPAALEPEFLFGARGIRARPGVALVSFGLDALPEAPGGADVLAGRVQIGARLTDIERAFDGVPAGRLPERPFVQLLFPSATDPSLATEGSHVATAWVQAVPRRIAIGVAVGGAPEYGATDGWEEGREQLANAVVAVIEEALPGFADRITAHRVSAPPDFEADFGAPDGCLYDADLGLDQALYLRPLAGWYGYRTPLRGLYLCSSGSHAGGGITALAGRNAAQRVLDDRKARAAGSKS
jgi:phytoene dehydrogenase-like protein